MKLEDSAFDSQHYDLRIGRLIPETHDDAAGIASALAEARARYDVAFLRYEANDPARRAIEEAGHRPVDTLITSTLREPAVAGKPSIAEVGVVPRIEHAVDLAAVEQITAENHWTSHLHSDPRLPAKRTQALYTRWALNDVTGRAQRTITARVHGDLVGYITVLDRSPASMIDLVAVGPAWHGKGIGRSMLDAFIAADRSREATVGTQAENPALLLYRRCGFVPTATHVTYHLWSEP